MTTTAIAYAVSIHVHQASQTRSCEPHAACGPRRHYMQPHETYLDWQQFTNKYQLLCSCVALWFRMSFMFKIILTVTMVKLLVF